MNVDTPAKSVGVGWFKTPQPNDPRDNRVSSRSVRFDNFSGKAAIPKNSSDWSVIANFFSDLQEPKRSRHPSPIVADSKLGGGDWIGGESFPVPHHHEFLLAHTDNDTARTLGVDHRSQRKQRDQTQGEAKHDGVLTSDR